ncbi:MAG: hypothetical protein QGG60_11040 [Anaerolineales bacterium]|jgi:hypothetical protein|nr:hypothetical protein [Anaerolineales bacterium]|tara:strand:- start:992 stop:1234 length:243 start_codon:yes stop_codon:yes gene_type:complete
MNSAERKRKWRVAEIELEEDLASTEDELDILLDSLGPIISLTMKDSCNIPGADCADHQGNNDGKARRMIEVETHLTPEVE